MRKTVQVSDMSGETIEEGKGAQMTINFADKRKLVVVADLTDAEAEKLKLESHGRTQQRRGRRAGSNAAPAASDASGDGSKTEPAPASA